MSTEHFIPGKDASLESSINAMQGKLEALGLNLEGCDMHQRWLAAYAKVQAVK